MNAKAQQVLDELCRRFRHAGGAPTKNANPLIDARVDDLAVAFKQSFKQSLSKAEVEDALEELARGSCVTKHQPGHYTLTPVGVRRGTPP